MNASKENARKSKRLLEQLKEGSDLPNRLNQVDFIDRFLDACATRLPREESYKRDKARRKEKAVAKA
jgi:hypothetical protein